MRTLYESILDKDFDAKVYPRPDIEYVKALNELIQPKGYFATLSYHTVNVNGREIGTAYIYKGQPGYRTSMKKLVAAIHEYNYIDWGPYDSNERVKKTLEPLIKQAFEKLAV